MDLLNSRRGNPYIIVASSNFQTTEGTSVSPHLLDIGQLFPRHRKNFQAQWIPFVSAKPPKSPSVLKSTHIRPH